MMASSSQSARERIVICGAGTVVQDDRNETPYPITGCMVGEPHQGLAPEGGQALYLRGMTFVTRIDREDARWPRNEAPDPCPHCGYSETNRAAS